MPVVVASRRHGGEHLAAALALFALVRETLRGVAAAQGSGLDSLSARFDTPLFLFADGVYEVAAVIDGRLVDNDVTLPFDFISRHHCELRFDHGMWVAIDLGSKNGLLNPANMRVDELVAGVKVVWTLPAASKAFATTRYRRPVV